MNLQDVQQINPYFVSACAYCATRAVPCPCCGYAAAETPINRQSSPLFWVASLAQNWGPLGLRPRSISLRSIELALAFGFGFIEVSAAASLACPSVPYPLFLDRAAPKNWGPLAARIATVLPLFFLRCRKNGDPGRPLTYVENPNLTHPQPPPVREGAFPPSVKRLRR